VTRYLHLDVTILSQNLGSGVKDHPSVGANHGLVEVEAGAPQYDAAHNAGRCGSWGLSDLAPGVDPWLSARRGEGRNP
jgi:hypothetical protein